MIRVFVPGRPRSKGSLVSGVTKDGRRFNRTQNAHGQERWAATVAHEVGLAMHMAGLVPFEGAVQLELVFQRPRPRSHYLRNLVRPSFLATLPSSRPDCDKLMRSVGDALQGIAYSDDAQVTTALVRKRWGPEGVLIVLDQDKGQDGRDRDRTGERLPALVVP